MNNQDISLETRLVPTTENTLESSKTVLFAINVQCCRVCLEEGNIPIYGNKRYKNVSEDLNALAGINVLKDDEYPKYLCKSCNCLLQSAIKLKVTAQYSDQILHRENFNPQHIQKHTTDAIDNQEETSSCYSRDIEELKLKFKYYKEKNFNLTIMPEILLNENYQCDKNSETTVKISKSNGSKIITLNNHKKSKSNIKLNRLCRNKNSGQQVKTKISRPVKKFECKMCHIDFETDAEYKLHTQSDEHKHFKEACPICSKKYAPRYLKKHLVYHKKEVTHICDICGKECLLKGQLVQHRRIHFFELPFKCPQCPYRGRDNYNLKKHQQSHSNNAKPYQCPLCLKQCTSKSNLTKHTLIHKTERDFKCDECRRGFYRKTDLERHFKSEHLGIKDYVCDVCGKAFGLRRQMMKHKLKVHKRPKLLNGRTPLYILAEQQNNKDPVEKPAKCESDSRDKGSLQIR